MLQRESDTFRVTSPGCEVISLTCLRVLWDASVVPVEPRVMAYREYVPWYFPNGTLHHDRGGVRLTRDAEGVFWALSEHTRVHVVSDTRITIETFSDETLYKNEEESKEEAKDKH